MAREDDSVRAMDALRRLVSALRTSGAEASREMGMSVAQLFALRTIRRHPGLSMGELAERTMTSPSAVSEVVSRLVERGVVHRETDEGDHRRIQLRLTWEGQTLCERVVRTIPEHLVAALQMMEPAARTALADGMEQWVADAGLGELSPAMFGETGPDVSRRPASRTERHARASDRERAMAEVND